MPANSRWDFNSGFKGLIFMDPCIVVWIRRNNQQDAPCNRIYYSKIYWRLNMFRAAFCSSSGERVPTQPGQRLIATCVYKPKAANTVSSSWWWAVCRSKHVEPSINFGIINSITRCILLVISTDSYYCLSPACVNDKNSVTTKHAQNQAAILLRQKKILTLSWATDSVDVKVVKR